MKIIEKLRKAFAKKQEDVGMCRPETKYERDKEHDWRASLKKKVQAEAQSRREV